MNSEEFQRVVRHLRQVGVDTQTCEVKESADNLVETLSAFANGTSGGTIILGLSEKKVFCQWKIFPLAKCSPPLFLRERSSLLLSGLR